MKNLLSGWTSTAAVAAVAGFVLLLLAVPAAQAQQQEEAIEAELRARLRAEMQQQLQTELQQRVEAELRQQMQQIEELERRLAQQAAVRERRSVAEIRGVEEAMRRRQEAIARAEQELRRRGRSSHVLRIRGRCDVFGQTVLSFAEELELSDDQVEQIRDAQRAARRAAIQRNADMEVGEMDLEALYEAETPDLTAIRAKLEELAILSVDQQMAGLDLREQVRAVLSEAQRQALEDMRMSDDIVYSVVSSLGVPHIGC